MLRFHFDDDLDISLYPSGHGEAGSGACPKRPSVDVSLPTCLSTEISMSRGVGWVGEGRLSLVRPFQKLLAVTPPLGGDAHATLGSHLHADSF